MTPLRLSVDQENNPPAKATPNNQKSRVDWTTQRDSSTLTYEIDQVGSVQFENLPRDAAASIDDRDLDLLLEFDGDAKTLQVHPNKILSTETYRILKDQTAVISLSGIWPLDRKTKIQLRDPLVHASSFERLRGRLAAQAKQWGGEFVEYEGGVWKWRASPLFA